MYVTGPARPPAPHGQDSTFAGSDGFPDRPAGRPEPPEGRPAARRRPLSQPSQRPTGDLPSCHGTIAAMRPKTPTDGILRLGDFRPIVFADSTRQFGAQILTLTPPLVTVVSPNGSPPKVGALPPRTSPVSRRCRGSRSPSRRAWSSSTPSSSPSAGPSHRTGCLGVEHPAAGRGARRASRSTPGHPRRLVGRGPRDRPVVPVDPLLAAAHPAHHLRGPRPGRLPDRHRAPGGG